MDKKPFYKKYVSAKVLYEKDPIAYKVHNVTIMKYEKQKFKSNDLYINKMINYIKDNIIKNCTNLKTVNIYINVYDKSNIMHKFIVNVSNIIKDFLEIKGELNFSKSIFIFIMEENKLIFAGGLDFSHLF